MKKKIGQRKLKPKNINWKIFSVTALLGFGLGIFFAQNNAESNKKLQASLLSAEGIVELGAFPIAVPTMKYGFAVDTFQVVEAEIQNNQFLADILLAHKVDFINIEALVQNAKEVFDVRNLRAGKPYTILTADTTAAADYFIYEPSVYAYYVFDLNQQTAKKVERPITKEIKTSAGIIESSLWNALTDNGMSYSLAAKMEDALQWSVDFHHLQKGDRFKMIYEQEFIDGEAVGVGEVYAAYYKNYDNEYYALHFEETENPGYYDLEGRPMNKGFLRAPVKYSRISSYYNLNRFHPVLKRRRAHLGTDYAAPRGTPIYAVGSGVVTKASYTKGNGNFVKIKHDDTYQTQYLHMSKFASGITSGVHVKQGQVIGYVGSTGLATGPHVCFRFWKNGKQVNHLKLNFPPPEPLPAQDLPLFYTKRDNYLKLLAAVQFMEQPEEITSIETKEDNL